MINSCRICLSQNADKDIFSLPAAIGIEKSAEQVILFCLSIVLCDKFKITTKLCSQCHESIQSFYRFKLLAQESDIYLKTLNTIKDENNVLNEESKDDINIDSYDNTVIICKKEKKTHEPVSPIKRQEKCPKEESLESIKKKKETPNTKKYCKNSFDCAECGKTYSSKHTFQIHQMKYHSDGVGKFQCDHCQKYFHRKFDLQRHVDRHIEWRCRICTLSLKTRYSYNNHVKSHKNGNNPTSPATINRLRVCPVCGDSVVNLSRHKMKHIPKDQRPLHKCKGCDKEFRSPAARNRHYNDKHLGLRYTCKECGKVVKNLLEHRRRYHRPDILEKHQCMTCNYKTVTAASLAIHVATHVEPHLPCPKCDKLFKSEARLSAHSRQVHNGEIRHVCQECMKGFFYKSDLTIHMATHTKERLHKCEHCYAEFKLRRNVLKHIKTHHNKKK